MDNVAAISRSLPPRRKRNGSKQVETAVAGTERHSVRRGFNGIRDKHGRATKAGKKCTEVKEKKNRSYPVPPNGYVFGVKAWLKRKEVWWEFGLCPRSVRRNEKRGVLHPSVLMGEYFYERAEIEAALRESKLLNSAGEIEALNEVTI